MAANEDSPTPRDHRGGQRCHESVALGTLWPKYALSGNGNTVHSPSKRPQQECTSVMPRTRLLVEEQSESSPPEALERYCKMDAIGTQLAVSGWLQLARMFVPQGELSPGPIVVVFDKLAVIRGFSIGEPVMQGHDRAKLTVRYSYLGEIDYTSLIFSSSKKLSTGQVGKDYSLLLTTKQYDIGASGEEVLLSGSKAWRIEGSPSEPHITIDAAIVYVTQLQNKATSASIKANGNITIDALNRLRLNYR
jgi:hypothetical protein